MGLSARDIAIFSTAAVLGTVGGTKLLHSNDKTSDAGEQTPNPELNDNIAAVHKQVKSVCPPYTNRMIGEDCVAGANKKPGKLEFADPQDPNNCQIACHQVHPKTE